MKITREDLSKFSIFVEENNLDRHFRGCKVYVESIYLDSGSNNYISWNRHANNLVMHRVVKAINAMFDLELEFAEGE